MIARSSALLLDISILLASVLPLAVAQEYRNPVLRGMNPDPSVVRVGEEYFLLDATEILAFQAEGDLVWIVTARKKYLATQTLKIIEQRLGRSSFQRIHRNALINVDHVRKMSALSSQRWLITLSNDQQFVASKRRAHGLRELLSE